MTVLGDNPIGTLIMIGVIVALLWALRRFS